MVENMKSYTQMRNEFIIKYQKEILPIVLRYEDERKKHRKLLRLVPLSIFLCLLVCFLMINFKLDENYFLVYTLMLISFFFMGRTMTLNKDFENKLKAKIMPIICSCFNNLNWSNGIYQDSYIIKDSNLVKKFNNEKYDDIFTGSYKNVDFEIIEAKLNYKDIKDDTDVFRGVIIKLDINKQFSGNTVIRPDSIGHFSPSPHLRHTILEDLNFEKKFDVYTNDEVEARYLITPSFMERLNNMKTVFEACSVGCAFYENYLLIGLNTCDLFSIGNLNVPLDDANQYFQMYDEILSIMKLIDHFKLDQKTGL